MRRVLILGQFSLPYVPLPAALIIDGLDACVAFLGLGKARELQVIESRRTEPTTIAPSYLHESLDGEAPELQNSSRGSRSKSYATYFGCLPEKA
jgi:hypothetical protein